MQADKQMAHPLICYPSVAVSFAGGSESLRSLRDADGTDKRLFSAASAELSVLSGSGAAADTSRFA